MDNFLKDNHDFYHYVGGNNNSETATAPKPEKRKGSFAVVLLLCLMVISLGISGGAGGVFLAEYLSENLAENKPFTNVEKEPVVRPQIPKNTETDSRGEPAENLFLITEDTLVINDNTTPFSPAELFEVVSDGVVGIDVAFTTGGGRISPIEEHIVLVGSGFIFTTDGYVLTNSHVIEGAEKVYVSVDDYFDPDLTHRYEAEIIGVDTGTDLAVLKITRGEEFKALPIGDSSTLRIGSFVSPIGYPLGLEKSMTHGIVSGLNREFAGGGYELNSIQFDAAVNSGNSGGPLFDMYGSVVGIVNKKIVSSNSASNQVDNIGLAITINDAKPIINDLLLYGEVMSRPMLGITPAPLNEYTAAMYGVDVTSGLIVRYINPMAPAYNSELLVGDIIVEINGAEVTSIADVQTILKNNKPGDTVELTVIRYTETGSRRTAQVEIELANAAELEWD